MKVLFFLLSFFFFLGCSKKQTNTKSYDSTTDTISSHAPSLKKDYIEIKNIKNRSYKEINDIYTSVNEENFLLNNVVFTEFRIGLLNHFSKKELKSSIQIKEMTWKLNTKENYTIWFQLKNNDWQQVDTLTWHKDSEF